MPQGEGAHGEYKDVEGAEQPEQIGVKEFSVGILAFIIFLASLVELISAGKECNDNSKCSGEFAWAVSVGTLSLAVSILYILMAKFSKQILQSIEVWFALFLSTLWLLGVGVLTFDEPFAATGNGYFACWLAFIASAALLYTTSETLRMMVADRLKEMSQHSGVIWVLLISSMMELIAASLQCKQRECGSQTSYGISVSIISICAGLAHMFSAALSPYTIFTAAIMSILWITAAGILTFDKPFTVPGNGYFAAWMSMFASCTWLYLCVVGRPNVQAGEI